MTLMILFAVSTLMVSALPAAMAMPGFSSTGVPFPAVAGSLVDVKSTAAGIVRGDAIGVYDQAAAIGTADDSCNNLGNVGGTLAGLELLEATPAGVSKWVLVTDDPVTANQFYIRFFLPSGGFLTAPFGNGVGTGFSVTVTAGGGLTDDGSAPTAASPDSITARWVDIENAAAPATDSRAAPTLYRIMACGVDDPAVLMIDTEEEDFFATAKPVGGTILPISATALFVAGLSNSAIWLLPLVALAGGAFALLRFQIYNK